MPNLLHPVAPELPPPSSLMKEPLSYECFAAGNGGGRKTRRSGRELWLCRFKLV